MDNLETWKEFSKQMEIHIKMKAIAYETSDSGMDLITTMDERIACWNILRYATRVWNGRKKDRDYFKIAHYAQVAWTKQREGR